MTQISTNTGATPETKKADPKAGLFNPLVSQGKCGRGKRIRTSGPCLPKTVLYQAELFPDQKRIGSFPTVSAGQERAYKDGYRGWQPCKCNFFRVLCALADSCGF